MTPDDPLPAPSCDPRGYASVRAELDAQERPDELSLDRAAYEIGWQLALDAVAHALLHKTP
jgi:hypothetical protein